MVVVGDNIHFKPIRKRCMNEENQCFKQMRKQVNPSVKSISSCFFQEELFEDLKPFHLRLVPTLFVQKNRIMWKVHVNPFFCMSVSSHSRREH